MDLRNGNSGIHWRVPTVMLTTFLAGLALAIGHHCFYTNLNGRPTQDALFEQQINIVIGTGFALLVRMCLVICMGSCYVQVFWARVMARPTQLGVIDVLYRLPGEIHGLFNPRLWLKHCTLALLAVASWTTPFATIVPPGTLSVRISPVQRAHVQMLQIPTIDFTIFPAFAEITFHDIGGEDLERTYAGPQSVLAAISTEVLTGGSILSIPSPVSAANSSFELSFFGPALTCQDESPTQIVAGVDQILNCNSSSYDPEPTDIVCDYYPFYVCWSPNATTILALSHTDEAYGQVLHTDNIIGSLEGEPLTFYFALNPSAWDTAAESWHVTRCVLQNASYTLKFMYQNGVLDIISDIRSVGPGPAYINQMSEGNSTNGTTSDAINAQLLVDWSSFSYQAVLDSVVQLLSGVVSYYIHEHGVGVVTSTSAMKTSLVYNTYLNDVAMQYSVATRSEPPQPRGNMSLSEAVEQVFINTTISLFHDPTFLTTVDDSTPYTPVTTYTTQTAYFYTSHRLVLAYGIAILITFITVIIGISTILTTKSTYSNNFSTIMRVTQTEQIARLTAPSETVSHVRVGCDPLPKRIEKAKVMLGSGAVVMKGNNLGALMGKEGQSTEYLRVRGRSRSGVSLRNVSEAEAELLGVTPVVPRDVFVHK